MGLSKHTDKSYVSCKFHQFTLNISFETVLKCIMEGVPIPFSIIINETAILMICVDYRSHCTIMYRGTTPQHDEFDQ